MKKFFLLIMASMMAVSMMAVGTGDGSSKANAIGTRLTPTQLVPNGTTLT